MRFKYIFSISAVFLAGVVFSGCKKDWLAINTNPNELPSTSPNNVFTGATNRIVATLGPNELGSYWSGQMTQSNTYIISTTIFAYNFNNTNFNYWDGWFDILQDLQYVINNANDKAQPFMKGPARVLKAYVYQQVVDMYGNAPYKDALQGLGSLAPKFDDQKAIYEDLVKTLDTAITELKANAFLPIGSSSDKVFGGNVTSWVRFANSLKLRLLIRQSRVAGKDAYIIAEINKAAATTEGFLAAGQDATTNPGYLASTGKTNPFYDSWGYDPSGAIRALARYPRPTVFLFNTLKATDDTFRLKRLFYAAGGEDGANPGVSVNPEVVSNYVPVPFGAASGYLSQNTSPIGPAIVVRNQFNKPMVFMTAAESFLLLAEAKQRYGAAVTIPSTAQQYYELGVKESFRITGTSAAAATTLLSSGKDLADWAASPDKLKAIWMQKWIALLHYSGLEAWSEQRRTNYPVTPASASAPVGAKVPLRLFYPQSESTSNGENVKAQGTVDVFNTRIFWDVD
jgi:Starch-binding associating with outer membrane